MSREAAFLIALFAAPPLLAAAAFAFFRRRAGRAAGPAGLLAGNALILLLLVCIGFAGFEVYYRWFYDETDAWNRSRVSRRWFERHWHVNAAGFRDDIEYRWERQAGTRRITFLGDSYTTAHGVKNVADRFANLIRAARPDWEIHALAHNGVNTLEEIEELRRLTGSGYELDVLVLVYCHNDIDSYVPEIQALYHRVDGTSRPVGALLRSSFAADFLYQRWRMVRTLNAGDIPFLELRRAAYRGAAWDTMQYNLDLLIADARLRGARLAVVTFPWMRMLLQGDPVEELHQAVGAYWSDRGVSHLDLLDVYRGLPARELVVNRRDTHPNERAHAIAADAILRFLEAEVLDPAGSGQAEAAGAG